MDRARAAIEAIIERLLSKVDYAALYPCTVVSQNGDGTLELRPDSSKIPGLSKVPYRPGIPGIVIKVNAGARVIVGFEDMNPSKPVATVWGGTGLKEVQIGGLQPVARQGDVVSVTLPPGTVFQGVAGPPVGPFVGTFAVPVIATGVILTGSRILKA